MDKFTNLGSSVSSTENDINARLGKAWTAIERLSVIWKQQSCPYYCMDAPHGCWLSVQRKSLMPRAVLNKFWKQHPTKQQLYGHLPPISKTIQIRQTRHVGPCWGSKYKLIRDILLWIPSHRHTSVGQPTYLQKLCTDTGCSLEDLPGVIDDRDG